MAIIKGFSGKLYPNRATTARLNQWVGACRFLWNRLLEMEIEQYRIDGTFLWKKDLQKAAIALKRQHDFLADLPAHAVLDTAARLVAALKAMKSGHRFPRFKKKFINEAGIYCVNQASNVEPRRFKAPKLGRIRMRGGSVPDGRLVASRIHRDGERWLVSAQFECSDPEPLPPSTVTFGIDLGCSTLATAHDGTDFIEIGVPRYLRKAERHLKRAQRRMSRRAKGTERRKAARRRVAAIHRKVHNQRKDFAHQVSHRLTAKAGTLNIETLDIRSMQQNRFIAPLVADAGMGMLINLIAYKAAWRGRTLLKIDALFPSSQLCSRCGRKVEAMTDSSRRMFRCDGCGYREARDRNAARNIYAYGEERRKGASARTDVEIGEQGLPGAGQESVNVDIGHRNSFPY
jgi:putative transposase